MISVVILMARYLKKKKNGASHLKLVEALKVLKVAGCIGLYYEIAGWSSRGRLSEDLHFVHFFIPRWNLKCFNSCCAKGKLWYTSITISLLRFFFFHFCILQWALEYSVNELTENDIKYRMSIQSSVFELSSSRVPNSILSLENHLQTVSFLSIQQAMQVSGMAVLDCP